MRLVALVMSSRHILTAYPGACGGRSFAPAHPLETLFYLSAMAAHSFLGGNSGRKRVTKTFADAAMRGYGESGGAL